MCCRPALPYAEGLREWQAAGLEHGAEANADGAGCILILCFHVCVVSCVFVLALINRIGI